MQVKMVTDSYMDIAIPVIGKVKVSIKKTTYLAKNMRKTVDSFSGDGFFSNWIIGMVSSTTGEVVDITSAQAWEYNEDDREYWIIPFIHEGHKEGPEGDEDQENRSISYSFSFSDKDDTNDGDELTNIKRVGSEEIKNIHGFRVREWATTVSRGNDQIVIDEWAVRTLPVLRLADSLNREIELARGTPDSVIDLFRFGSGFSNNEILLGIPSLDSLMDISDIDPIDGEVIKGNVSFFKDDELEAGFGSEIIEIYAETFDPLFYTIPEGYDHIENE